MLYEVITEYLQASDHFYYMATKFFSDGAVHAYFNPYETPYDAFMNYMNVLSDFEIRVNRFIPDIKEQTEISKLNELIREKELIIDQQLAEISELKYLSTRKMGQGRTAGKKKTVTTATPSRTTKKPGGRTTKKQ